LLIWRLTTITYSEKEKRSNLIASIFTSRRFRY